VARATKEQAEIIIEKLYKNTGQKNLSVVFAAVDEEENIIGYLVAEEKIVPPPINGTDWFIWNIYSLPELRRHGIGSAILHEVIKQAEQENVRHLIGSCTNTPAHLFWLRHGFCFQIYGQKIDDVNRPNEHGNVPHMIFYRVNKTAVNNTNENEKYKIVKADSEQLDNIFNDYIVKKSAPFFKDNKKNIIGFTAIDDDEKVIGFITACPYDMGTPIDGMQWLVPCISVNSEMRRKGIGSALLKQLIKSAQEENINQISLFSLGEDEITFLYNNNFDICVMYIAKTQDGKNPISAAKRI
jgi:GNAT superfamily N-acetyltransferase